MNPLDQLAPLIRPEPIPFWPLAPGWWIALACLLVLPVAVTLLWRRRHQAVMDQPVSEEEQLEGPRRAALIELAQMPRPYGESAGPWLQNLNALLKRLCLARYPDSHCQTLSGRAWLAFLDTRCTAAGLTRWMVLVEGAYRPDCRLDDKTIDGLYAAVGTWIRKHV
ncbi:DUF4381 domain-containing protein [Pseudomonas asuensis]|nr:DUF4381 domain-containing protein [Pseudomonas asuensis]